MSEQQKNVPLLHIENLRVSFKGEDRQYIETVKGISFDIPANTTVALVGESGSGKSVTSLATMGLLPVGQSKIDEKRLFLKVKIYSAYPVKICEKSVVKILP